MPVTPIDLTPVSTEIADVAADIRGAVDRIQVATPPDLTDTFPVGAIVVMAVILTLVIFSLVVWIYRQVERDARAASDTQFADSIEQLG